MNTHSLLFFHQNKNPNSFWLAQKITATSEYVYVFLKVSVLMIIVNFLSPAIINPLQATLYFVEGFGY